MSSESKYTHASNFARYLRKNGIKVIDGSCKLSLSSSALCLLNHLFAEVLNPEWPDSLDMSGSNAADIASDVKYLYDFIKRTSFLKLFHSGQTLRGGVDLSQFSNLKTLELRKIPTHLIIGLDCLSVQLRALICSRSIYLLKELFGTSMNDQNVIKIWEELKELNLSYNYLDCLDYSLKCLPNIEILDLSHNHIQNTNEIQILKNLNFVNLSYNELVHLPLFNRASCRSLTKLYMRNNNLEDLEGLDCLFNLEELDVGYNLLSDYHVLNPLDKLKVLRVLNLEGNPLFFHNRHTILVARFINPSVLNRGIRLNGKLIAAPQAMPSFENGIAEANHRNHHQTSINTVVGDAESMICGPSVADRISRSISEVSEKSSLGDNSVSSLCSLVETEVVSSKKSEKKPRKKKSKAEKKIKKSREVLINEYAHYEEEAIVNPVNTIDSIVPPHMKAKEIAEARRLERGEAWLIPDNSFQRLKAPIPKVPSNTPMSSYVDPRTLSEMDLLSKVNSSLISLDAHSPKVATPPSSSVIMEEMSEVLNIEVEVNANDSEGQVIQENDDIEVLNANCQKDSLDEIAQRMSCGEDISDCDIYGSSVNSHDKGYENEGLESDEESEDSMFFVEKKEGDNKQAVIVYIGANYIRETDAISGKIIDKLDLNILQSVRTTNEETDSKCSELHLEFDTVKTSRQKRVYIFEEVDSAKVMSKILQPFADAKTLKEVTLGALECLKCNSQFSKQAAHKILVMTKRPINDKDIVSSSYDSNKEYPQEVDACPNCRNHILVEMETIPLPSVAAQPGAIKTSSKKSDKSPDSLSVGSASSGNLFSSLFTSMKISPILKRRSNQGGYNIQNEGASESSSTVTGDLDPTPSADVDKNGMRRNSSDITIISNPSQSSIAVIPDPESYLNTIPERDSQSSLSPPISQDSIFYKGHNASESEEFVEPAQKVQHQNPAIDNEPDFYSITESCANGSASHFATSEVLSSESEKFTSPFKSAGSDLSNSNTGVQSDIKDETSQILTVLGEKRTISYETFSEIDHRLKLHLEINVLGENEQVEACLQTSIVPLSTGDEFAGLFALSNSKLYIFKFSPLYHLSLKQSESIEKVVQLIHSSPLNQLKQVKVILGNQGISIACGSGPQVFTLVIRDADVCNSFSSLLSDFFKEHQTDCEKIEFISSADETIQLIKDSIFSACESETEETPEVLLHLFAYWYNSRAGEKDSSTPVCVIVTRDDIFISRILYKKQDSIPDMKKLRKHCMYHYNLMEHQKLFDLTVPLKIKKDLRSVEVCFLDESSQNNCDSVCWTINMETKSALFSFISALRGPWEEIFSVPLSLTYEEE